MGTNLLRTAAVLSAICWAAGIAHAAASWLGQPYSVSIPTHISHVNQIPITASSDLTLQHDAACNIMVSVAVAGNEVLTTGGAGGPTLTTAYMLSGADVSDGDAAWVSAGTFVTKTYHVVGTGPNSTITIAVQATPPPNRAPDAGPYSASIVLTATW